ncbi:MAG: hypothetical protein JNM17_21840 [Archangium sp.]|nr:hypothetical protein [Archangium sp.]
MLSVLVLGCQRKDAWGDQPTECATPQRALGKVESYVIDGKTRGVQYRLVPDVLAGSLLVERQGRLLPEANELGIIEFAVVERPSERSVQLTYTQGLPDGGLRETSEVFRCHPLVSPTP